MELLSGYIVFVLVNLATATPYGYGAKSGAVAKAEASASAGAFAGLPVIPLPKPGSPGFSGSFSKSSSSSFASSSASSSSSSSSFSYSGAGSNVIPGFGTHTSPGCGGNCQHNDQDQLGSSNQVPNDNSGTQGFNFAGASAGATANSPCKGSYCNSSGKKCSSNQCGETENLNGNNVGSSGNSQSDSDNMSNDYAVNIANKPQSTGSEQNNKPNKYNNNGQFESSEDKISNENTKSSDCESPDCGSFVSHTPESNNLNYNKKPSSHLETPYQEQACTTHDCNLGIPNSSSNSGKPSSYNVPILGNQHTKTDTTENPSCASGKCQISDDYSSNKQDIMKPSSTLQVPTGSSGPSPCNTGECSNPNYSTASVGSDQSASYQPTGSAGHAFNLSHQPIGVVSSSVNPSGPATTSQPTGVIDSSKNPSYQPTAPTGFDKSPVGSSGFDALPALGAYPSYHPSQTGGSYNKPSYHTTVPAGSRTNPSYQSSGTTDSGISNTYKPSSPTGTEMSSRPLGHGNNPISHIGAELSPSAYPSYHPSGNTGSYKNPSYHPSVLAGSGINPLHEPSGVAGSDANPSYNTNIDFGINPSFQPSVFDNVNSPSCASGNCANPSYHSSGNPISSDIYPNGPNTGFIPKPCNSGNCANPSYQINGIISSPPGHPDNAVSNVKLSPYPQLSTDNQNFHTSTSLGCKTPNCHPYTGSGPSYDEQQPSYDSSIIANSKPSKTVPEILLSNKGNQIYTGGFGGPTGVLSPNSGLNNKDKPSVNGIFVNPPHDSGTHLESKPQFVPQPSNVPNHSHQGPTDINHQPSGSTNLHPMGSVHPNVGQDSADENKPQYTGGFGGPAGLLKPNEYTIPSNTPKSTCSSGSCDSTQVNQIGTVGGLTVANAAAVASAKAVSYSGGFGGPPGLLKPYDEGKLDKSGQNVLGKESNVGNGHDIGTTNNLQPHYSNGIAAGSQGSAIASASATAGSYGHSSGGCNTGCSLHRSGHDLDQNGALGQSNSGLKDGLIANAAASAKSVAGANSYAHGRSVASASAHASAGASTKGGYTWK